MAGEKVIERLRAEAALPSTYQRGVAIWRDGGVLKLAKNGGELGSTVGLTGRVAGSDGGYYSVSVDLDTGSGEVLDYSCGCPAAANYDGMCKHEVALALEYLNGPAPQPVAPVASLYSVPAPRRPSESATSGAVSDLLQEATERRLRDAGARRRRAAGALRGERPAEKATLLVHLGESERSFSGDGAAMKLTVRRGNAKYIVKNVASLVRAWRDGDEVSYGKKLSFAHTRDAFDARSAELLDLVGRIVDTQQALYLSRWDYAGGGRGTDIKELPLSDADACDVLDVMQGASVQFDVAAEPERDRWGYLVPKKRARDFPVGEGDPGIECEIIEGLSGGYDIVLPDYLRVFVSGQRCYVVEQDCVVRASAGFATTAAPVLAALRRGYGTPHVNTRDVPEFCRSVLPVLRDWCDLEAPASLAEAAPPDPEFSFRISLEDGQIVCWPKAAYGQWETLVGGPEDIPGQPPRDLAAEYHVLDVLEDYFPVDEGRLVFDEEDEELLYRLLTDGLAELSALGEVLLSDRLRAINVRSSPSLSVRATVKSNLLDVELGASGLTQRELLDYLAGWKRKQKFVRLSTGDIVRIGENLQFADELADGLGVSVEELVGGDFGLPSSRALLIDALLDRADGIRLNRDSGFRRLVRDFDTYSDADIEVPADLKAELRAYQEDGFRWLGTLERFGFGGILADDMGLGKTLQVIAHILARKEAASAGEGEQSAGPTLVICPASLVYNWMSEIAKFAPSLDAVAVVGTKTARTAVLGGAAGKDVLVTSYDLLRRDVESYAKVRFARVVLDEAQYIKNPKAQVTKCVKCLDADVRFALTGTPIENRLAELWSIFDFLMPGYLGSREQFAKRYEGPVEHADHDSSNLLRCAIGPFVLRRLKSEVLADLPEKTESVVYAQMEAKQRKLYLASQDRLALQVQHMGDRQVKQEKLKVLAELTKLRQLCCDPRLYFEGYDGGSAKLETCMELVSQAVAGGHKVLLFSQFTSMLELIGQRLRAEHLTFFQLTGATSKEERERLVKRFQAGEADVFLISLKAGGVGLNLTSADVVIHYDPWWNTAAQDQATDRAHRIGQRRDVSVFKLICEGTIEERILRMQESKRDLADSVLSGEGVKSALLTRDDLLALLGSV